MRTYQHSGRVRSSGLVILGCLVLLASYVLPAAAQQRRYLFEVGAAGNYQSFDSETALSGAVGGVGRIGFWLPINLSIELEASTAGSDAPAPPPATGTVDVRVTTLSASLLYNFLIGANSSLYLKAGGGTTKYGEDCPTLISSRVICGRSGAILAGAGVRVGLTPTLFARGEGLLTRNRSDRDPLPSIPVTNFGFSLGLSYMLGSRPIPDSDADGILDNRDRCAATPAGAQVDGRGCTADSDEDGVPNGVDRCLTTIAGATVDAVGCTRDSDSDNIPDGLDRCPETQTGVLVDPRGCPRDSDGDVIPDGLDRCSDTPRGATVDALGCPGDEDGDGVLDGLDRCPRSAAGARVNPLGCAPGQSQTAPAPAAGPPPEPEPEPVAPSDTTPPEAEPEPVRTPAAQRPAMGPPGRLVPGVLQGVEFAPGTARLASGSYVVLDSLVRILLADPALRVEIAAHTDNTGTAAANLHITNLQAEAVKNYLVTKGVPFQQVVARGFGATVPLTPDTTPRGRAANRRVEVRPATAGP